LYEYEVVALKPSGEPSSSVTDYAVTRPFSDDPITVGSTLIRGSHIGELREAADAWRRFSAELSNAFGSYGPASGVVAASDIKDIVTALNDARDRISSLSQFTFTNVPPPALGGLIRAEHVQQLRSIMK
jgi:hypothetical protein